MDKINYIECVCHDLEHVTRVSFIEDEDFSKQGVFYFEYKVTRFPGHLEYLYYNTFWNKLKYHLNLILRYFRNIWWSIKGRPLWFTGYAEIEPNQAHELITFMDGCLNEKAKSNN